ncbi:zf-HC2 domain-containing protein [Actinoplanes sp. NBRC 103695]|uniref:zf-HC2 domain-containing protein n=1 Tax=Actinoplanes sp. NBRC 103695 TaxID=3032202 RepID=UPI0024A5F53B|nr:hypothetical protein Acsp02_95010 [Actinoplanes sp. NBRC 103695]
MTDASQEDPHPEEEHIVLHFLGELDPADSDTLHQHLASCPQCQAKSETITDTLAALALDTADTTDTPTAPTEDRPSSAPPDLPSRRRRPGHPTRLPLQKPAVPQRLSERPERVERP